MHHFPKVMGLPEDKGFQADEYPMIVCNFMGVTELWVSDPEIAQDIFVTKNAILDKHPEGFLMF